METEEQINVLTGNIVKMLLQQKEKYEQLLIIDNEVMQCDDEFYRLEEKMVARSNIFSQLAGMAVLVATSQQELAQLLNIKDKSWESILAKINKNVQLKDTLIALRLQIKNVITVEEELVSFLENIRTKNLKELKIIKQYRKLETAYLDRPEQYPAPNIFDVQE